ncbi:amino acid ABC transporter permease [Phyllobacterium sp. SB3]|uniref:amino acid ABC transporter permease n=1 Tax=Phyllobacterium sp. SB3 TaxID=3156073 RepID=UPI0032AF282D
MRTFMITDLYFLLYAAGWTVIITLVSFCFGGILGLAIALAKLFGGKIPRLIATAFVELLQSTPVLMLLFLSFYGLNYLGFRLPPFIAAGAALSLFAGAFLGEIWRGSIEAIEKSQWEASEALAMTRFQQCRYIIFPQAIRIALAPTIGFLAQLIKNTSIAALIGFVEITRAGQILNNMTFQPFLIFSLVAVIYFVICYPLSAYSQRLEEKLNASRSA